MTLNDSLPTARCPADRPAKKFSSLIILILALNLLLKLIYTGHNYYINSVDESQQLQLVKIVLQPGWIQEIQSGNFHPLLSVFILKLGELIWGPRLFFMRLLFLLLSSCGLFFFYLFCRQLKLSPRAAGIALFLAAVDQYFLHAGSLITERAYFSLVPLCLYLFWRALDEDQPKLLWAAGLAAAAGFWLKEAMIILLLPSSLFLLFSPPHRRWFRRWETWIALLLFLALIAPYWIWESGHSVSSLDRNLAKTQQFGCSPRIISLYLGELILPWVLEKENLLLIGHRLWRPDQVTVQSAAGLLYLIGVGYAFIRLKGSAHFFLGLIFVSYTILATIPAAGEPWNNFWWGAETLIPAIIWTGILLDRVTGRNKLLQGGLLLLSLYFIVQAFIFVSQKPGSTYWKHLDEERALPIKFIYYIDSAQPQKAEGQCRAYLKNHPGDRKIQGLLSYARWTITDMDNDLEPLKTVVRLHPEDTLLQYYLAKAYFNKRDYVPAALHWEQARQREPGNWIFYFQLAECYQLLGRRALALKAWEKVIQLKPDQMHAREQYRRLRKEITTP